MSDLMDIHKKIADLQKLAVEARARELDKVIEELKAKIVAYQIDPKTLWRKTRVKNAAKTPKTDTKKAVKKPKTKAPAKYAGPNGESWSGRGLMPKWMKTLTEAGQIKESFKIPDAS